MEGWLNVVRRDGEDAVGGVMTGDRGDGVPGPSIVASGLEFSGELSERFVPDGGDNGDDLGETFPSDGHQTLRLRRGWAGWEGGPRVLGPRCHCEKRRSDHEEVIWVKLEREAMYPQ